MKEPINISARPVDAAPAALSLGDLCYIFFRHKWKILLIFLAGIAGATGLYLLKPPAYQSVAKILIRYVVESQPQASVPGAATDSRVVSPDSRGDGIMNSQIEILTSLDLALLVAESVGAERVLAKSGGGNNISAAAAVIRGGLLVEAPRRGSVVQIAFSHPDPAVVQPVLDRVVKSYLEMHQKLYQQGGMRDQLFTRQADELRAALSQTEEDIKKLKTDTRIVSLADSVKAYEAQQGKIEEDLFAAEAELAEQNATLAAWEKLRPGQPLAEATPVGVPLEVADRYRTISAELEFFQTRRSEAQSKFKDEHPQVKRLTEEVARTEGLKRELEQRYTNLTSLTPPPTARLSSKGGIDLTTEVLRVSALAAKIKVLTDKLAEVRKGMNRIIDTEPKMTKLLRQKETEEANLNYYTVGLKKIQIDEEMAEGKITNIGIIQTPTPPSRDTSGLLPPLGAVLALGLFGGFALAFLIERFLDRSLKRVVDLERVVRAPVFVTVPDLGWKGNRLARLITNGHPATAGRGASDGAASHVNGNGAVADGSSRPGEVAPWDSRHVLRSYYEGLRDRLITYFEVRNLTHKPKLVAVTSCRRGAGVTTMAAGLAATLSETGDGNVLLVDMNLESGAAHQFSHGKPGCALSDALENATRDPAQVQENLYLVSAHETSNDKLPRALPKRFAHLIPRMKASDYDYIIFDMPPISQTSVTPRLAGLMDMVLVVVEAEKTNQDSFKRAHVLLTESRATVATVLNKHRAYIPERFSHAV